MESALVDQAHQEILSIVVNLLNQLTPAPTKTAR